MDEIGLTVNGQRRSLNGTPAHTTTLDWLRGSGLTGCKEGCAEGECGACAILVRRPDDDGGSTWTSVNACLLPAAALNGQDIVTAEGLGTPEELHPVQEELAARGGSQCGYCTPGFVCSMAAEFYRRSRPAEASHQDEPTTGCGEHGPNGFDLHSLSGNLCRCTGYRPIRDAAYALGVPDADDDLATRRNQPAPPAVATDLRAGDGRFVRPSGLAEALELLAEEPEAELISGATDWGVEVNLRGRRAPLVVAIDRLPELNTLSAGKDFVDIGAAVALSDVERRLAGTVPILDQLIPQFASRLIRNRATIGGNIGTGSPIGDAPPALLALVARVVLVSATGTREVHLSEYFTGYRQTVRRPDELIQTIRIPQSSANLSAFHKIAKRRFDDISSVAVGYALEVRDGVVRRARIGLGGVAATPVRARDTEAILTGAAWNDETVQAASASLMREGTPMSDHRASAEYRSMMLANSIRKVYGESMPNVEVGA